MGTNHRMIKKDFPFISSCQMPRYAPVENIYLYIRYVKAPSLNLKNSTPNN